ncbi:MAG: hypothetical protein K2H10_07995, partial [Bacteroidales bacterium]|nr:hypothetical protein [Bacteroidales bacterium]
GIRQAPLDKNVPNSKDDIATNLKKNPLRGRNTKITSLVHEKIRFRGQNSFGSTCFHLTLLLRVNLRYQWGNKCYHGPGIVQLAHLRVKLPAEANHRTRQEKQDDGTKPVKSG